MLGFLPWFALVRRIFASFFFVFFDIGRTRYPAKSDCPACGRRRAGMRLAIGRPG
jgi:hypothetical protein